MMDTEDKRIRDAVRYTEILRTPKRSLYTFSITNISYYLVTEPVYVELSPKTPETVVRKGKVIAEKPRIVTPYYLSRLEGFSTEARRYFEALMQEHGQDMPGLFYTYRNELQNLTIVSDNLMAVVEKLNSEIDRRGDPMVAIIKGKDELWDVSIMKFIYEITRSSLPDNVMQMSARGLLDIDTAGVPVDARERIDELFEKVARGEIEPGQLKEELDRWGLFGEYEDKFFSLFQKM